jgi:hypothetical protein
VDGPLRQPDLLHAGLLPQRAGDVVHLPAPPRRADSGAALAGSPGADETCDAGTAESSRAPAGLLRRGG